MNARQTAVRWLPAQPPPPAVWAQLPPGPRGQPLVGCALQYLRSPLGFITRCFRTYGRRFTVPWVGFPVVFLIGPDANRLMLSDQAANLLWRPALANLIPLLGEGVLITDGDLHDRLRRLVLPAFQRGRIESYVPVMADYADRYLCGWRTDQVVEIDAAMRELTLQVAGQTLFGVDLASERSDFVQDFQGTREFLRLQWPFNLIRVNLPFTAWGRFVRARADLDRFIYRLIRERRADPTLAERSDALAALLSARTPDGETLSTRQVRDQVLTLLAAGHDTTAHGLAWTLYLLARHPAVLARVLAEQDAVLGGRPPTPDTLRQLVYLEMVAKEALRLYPPAWAGARVAATEIAFRGYRIPAGTTVVYSQWLSHRLPEVFPDPDRFRPERFDPERGEAQPPFAYVPFGGGARLCLGMSFALQEMKVVLSALLSRWRLTLEPGQHVQPRAAVTLSPRSGIYLRVQPA
jgi:cytochrome P450